MKKLGIELIAEERQQQIEKHGYTLEHDSKWNSKSELIQAAEALLMDEHPTVSIQYFPTNWNSAFCMKMATKPWKERLVVAASLIAAEIDRLSNLEV